MLIIDNLSPRPIISIPYEYLEAGGGIHYAELPVLGGNVSGLPSDLDGLILTSDLQGAEPSGVAEGAPRPLGTVVAAWLSAMGDSRVIPDPARTGIVLAGDLYGDASLAGRGGSGDVSDIWEAFASNMAWVIGVAGNHDRFGAMGPKGGEWKGTGNCHLLDGGIKDMGSLRVAGLSGLIGRAGRPYRRPEPDYLNVLRRLCLAGPDITVLHQSPDGGKDGYPGSAPIRECLESMGPRFVVAGHTPWTMPLVALRNGGQVLNVAGRVVVLRRRRTSELAT
jgi:Icc protein